MPHIWNNISVVTKDELVPKYWSSYEVLKVELYRYKNKSYGLERAQLGGNGRQLLIKFDSLPRHIQEELNDQVNHPLMKIYKTDAEAVTFYTNFERPGYGYLKPSEYEKYITNASMIKALEELEKRRITERIARGGSIRASKHVKSVSETIYNDAFTFQEILQDKWEVQHTLPTNPRRFRQTIKKFQENGFVALIKDAKGKSLSNARKLDEDTQSILNYLFGSQHTKPTATEVARQYEAFKSGYIEVINNATGECYNPQDFPALSASSITNWLASWDSKIGTEAKRSGDRQKLMQKFEPYHSLENPTFAGSLISIDDRQPPFEYEKGKRMWWYLGIDLASKAIVAWAYGKTKEGIILDFYRQLVRNYHEWGVQLPHGLECESSLNSSYKNTFLRPGAMFQDVRIEANNARGKRIERHFGELRYLHEKQEEGWIARPFAKSESNQKGSHDVPKVPYKQLVQQGFGHIMNWNNYPHPVNNETSRWDYFMNNQNPDLKPTNYKAILPHLGYKTKTSCNAGIIRFNSGEWLIGQDGTISTGEDLIGLMQRVEGNQIDIYWLDDNQGNPFVAFIYIDDQYICEAIQKPVYPRAKVERTPEHEKARDLMTRYAATIQAYQKTQKNSIESVTLIDNRPKLVNNNFQIPGMASYQPKDIEEDVEILPSFDDDDFETIESSPSAQPNWRDTFLK